jgi:GTPase SAR1 family protein
VSLYHVHRDYKADYPQDALEKASIPSVLVSNKCDRSDRQLDPNNIEQRAKAVLRSLNTLQSSTSHVGSHSKGISSLLQAVSGKSHPSSCPILSATMASLPRKHVLLVKAAHHLWPGSPLSQLHLLTFHSPERPFIVSPSNHIIRPRLWFSESITSASKPRQSKFSAV